MLRDIQRNIVQQRDTPAAILLEVQGINADTISLTRLHKRIAGVGKLVAANADFISWFQYLVSHLLRVHVSVIGAAQIHDVMAATRQLLYTCVIAGNLGIV